MIRKLVLLSLSRPLFHPQQASGWPLPRLVIAIPPVFLASNSNTISHSFFTWFFAYFFHVPTFSVFVHERERLNQQEPLRMIFDISLRCLLVDLNLKYAFFNLFIDSKRGSVCIPVSPNRYVCLYSVSVCCLKLNIVHACKFTWINIDYDGKSRFQCPFH